MTYLITINNWVAANPTLVLMILLVAFIFKGFALYRAARKDSVVWFWVILVFNTLGILPLLYLIFSEKAKN